MTILALAALLAANPAAQVEHNALIATARSEGEAAGEQRVEARITAASPFLNNEKYGVAVGAVALKVIKGEEAAATLTTIVTILDAQTEQAATAAATGAAQPAAPAQPQQPAAVNGIVSSDADLDAACAQLKGGN